VDLGEARVSHAMSTSKHLAEHTIQLCLYGCRADLAFGTKEITAACCMNKGTKEKQNSLLRNHLRI